ncbi:hypothetical protein [Paractinoplanes abujensis]|nr:hypothetical protein [Actinoplanes abujensis]
MATASTADGAKVIQYTCGSGPKPAMAPAS